MRVLRSILFTCVVVAAATAAACTADDPLAGTPGTVTIRGFIDADGSGGYTAPDAALAGTVTLTGPDGEARQAALDATGLALFTDVLPGSYRATFAGTVANGAILASAPTATVVVPFLGGDVPATFRYVFTPGSVSGTLFRDDNSNGHFDAGIDTPAPGMAVALFTGSDLTATPVGTATTGAAGQFEFRTVRPGDYTVRITPIPTIQITGGTTRPVTVGAAGVAQTSVQFTGNLLSSIATARSSSTGSTVAFTGVATANAGLVGSNQLYVQDASGAVLVFGAPTAGIVAGDTVRVIGVTAVFNGELEVVAPAGGALSVTKVGSGAVPAPRGVSVAELIGGQFAGRLVSVVNVRVRGVATTGATAYNVNVQGATAADTFQVRVGNSTTVPIPSTFWQVGSSYDVSGLDGVFNGLPQLKPRAAADVVTAAASVPTIAAAKAVSNDTVTVEGVVTAIRGTFRTDNAYIQDATSGVQIFNLPASLTLALGDAVRVHGKMTVFSGENEITNTVTPTDSIRVTRLGSGSALAPKLLTGAQFLSRSFEGQLVTLQNVTIVSVGTAGGSGTYTVNATAADGSALVVFMSAPTGTVPPPTIYTVGAHYDLTGIAVPFGTPSAAELKPRGAGDVVAR